MAETMTIAEIREKYKNQWILITEPVSDDHDELIYGRVVCASQDRAELHEAAMKLPRPINIAYEYTGPAPQRCVVSAWHTPSTH